MPVNKYGSGPIAFRTGSQKNQMLEVIHNDLNTGRGTAYNIEEGTAVYYENYAYAKALAAAWETVQAFANQFNPTISYQFLDRWESILGIIPPNDATITDRQAVVSLYFKRFSLPPTLANLEEFTKIYLGDIFIGFEFYDPISGVSFMPGGATIPGGMTVNSGDWKSYLSFINVRIWQPRDKYNNVLMSDATFTAKHRSFYKFFQNYLPAYMSYSIRQYASAGNGSIYCYANSTALTGIGTNFTGIGSNKTIEAVDDFGKVITLKVQSINSDTSITLSDAPTNSITGNVGWRVSGSGFILDVPFNLDNETFSA